MNGKPNKALETLLERIASKELGIETLKTRRRDALDFHDLDVASILDALLTAYLAGAAALQRTIDAEQARKAVAR